MLGWMEKKPVGIRTTNETQNALLPEVSEMVSFNIYTFIFLVHF